MKNILIFDELGKVYKLPVHKIAFSDRNSPGIDIRMIIKNLTANINSVFYEPCDINTILAYAIEKNNTAFFQEVMKNYQSKKFG